MIAGMTAALGHPREGMPVVHMHRFQEVAAARQEVILVRPVSIWATKLIEEGYPTKGYHIKGKSSDWGPHAGLIAVDQAYSKIDNVEKARRFSGLVEECVHEHWAVKMDLVLSAARIAELRTKGAIGDVTQHVAQGENRLFMTARRSLDNQRVLFVANRRPDGKYKVDLVTSTGLSSNASMNMIARRSEVDADSFQVLGTAHGALTADYDLLAVCPKAAHFDNRDRMPDPDVSPRIFEARMNRYGSNATRNPLAVSGSNFTPTGFLAGRNMNTTASSIQQLRSNMPQEDRDMGNITQRLREAVIQLNRAMARGAGLDTVHHNADSGSLATDLDGDFKDGYGMTVFQPVALNAGSGSGFGQGQIPAGMYFIDNFQLLKEYFVFLRRCHYFPPRNPLWNMGSFLQYL